MNEKNGVIRSDHRMLGQDLRHLVEKRQRADYVDVYPALQTVAQEALTEARRVISVLGEL